MFDSTNLKRESGVEELRRERKLSSLSINSLWLSDGDGDSDDDDSVIQRAFRNFF